MSPIHGRTSELRAVFTSRSINPHCVGFSEVDIIAASVNLPSTTFKPVGECPTWGDPELPDSGTHLPVLIVMAVPTVASLPTIAKPQRKAFCNPPYSDSGWFQLANRIADAIPNVRIAIRSPNATATSMYIVLRDFYRNAAISQFGAPAMRSRTYRHRLYRGVQLPAPIVEMFAEARALRRRVSGMSDPVLKQELHDKAHNIAVSAKKLAGAFVSRFLSQLVRNIESERAVDPHNMHAHLRLIEGTDSTRCIDSTRIPTGPGGTDPCVLFHDKWSGLSAETDPLPQGPQQAASMSMVPENDIAHELIRLFTAKSVYWLLYPATKRHAYVACHVDCCICTAFIAELDAWDPDSPDSPIPHHSPSLRTGRSAGPDDLVAELIRFVRPEAYASRYHHRLAICDLIAAWFNEMLRTGRVPDGDFAKCCTTPLLKAVKPGQPVPPLWDPDVYRGITNGNMLAKLFSVALAMRMSHWAVRTKTIGLEQVAFLQYHNTEEHVFTLLQVARARARDGLSTYGLFVDFTKAYDMVHQGALWLVVARMGVPPRLISLLRDWAAKRRTRVKVNGALSAEYPMAKGVPQGDPLSCLLFSLFIESLSRFLKSRPDLSGASAFGDQIRLLLLLYADDLLILADSAAELQRALYYIKEWSEAWRMPISTGAGKTEALLMSTVVPRPVCPAPLQFSPGVFIQWGDGYKYLGYLTRADLKDDDATARLKEHMEFMWNAKFVHSGIVRRASPTFQLQYFACLVQGALQYLRSLTVCNVTLSAALESCLSSYHRDIFRLPSGSPAELVAATARIPPWHAVHAQHHERLYQQLLHTPFQQSIAARVFRLARADPRKGTSAATRNWVACWEAERGQWLARGVSIPPADLPYHRIAENAAEFARSIAFWHWQHRGRVVNGIQDGDLSFDAALRPSWQPKRATAALFEGFNAPQSAPGLHPRYTPVSTHGPMCQGSLLSLSTIAAHKLSVIGHMRLGAKALQMDVLSRNGDGRPRDRSGDEDHDGDSRFMIRREHCPLCNEAPLDPFHLACLCPNATMAAWRMNAQREARRLLCKTAQLLRVAHDGMRRDLSALCNEVICEASALDVSTNVGQFVLFRLLVMMPWSARLAQDDMSFYVATVIGSLFDASGLPNRLLRPLANTWGHWSIRWCWRLGNSWRAACAQQNAHVPVGT
jgi:hypothetical protein